MDHPTRHFSAAVRSDQWMLAASAVAFGGRWTTHMHRAAGHLLGDIACTAKPVYPPGRPGCSSNGYMCRACAAKRITAALTTYDPMGVAVIMAAVNDAVRRMITDAAKTVIDAGDANEASLCAYSICTSKDLALEYRDARFEDASRDSNAELLALTIAMGARATLDEETYTAAKGQLRCETLPPYGLCVATRKRLLAVASRAKWLSAHRSPKWTHRLAYTAYLTNAADRIETEDGGLSAIDWAIAYGDAMAVLATAALVVPSMPLWAAARAGAIPGIHTLVAYGLSSAFRDPAATTTTINLRNRVPVVVTRGVGEPVVALEGDMDDMMCIGDDPEDDAVLVDAPCAAGASEDAAPPRASYHEAFAVIRLLNAAGLDLCISQKTTAAGHRHNSEVVFVELVRVGEHAPAEYVSDPAALNMEIVTLAHAAMIACRDTAFRSDVYSSYPAFMWTYATEDARIGALLGKVLGTDIMSGRTSMVHYAAYEMLSDTHTWCAYRHYVELCFRRAVSAAQWDTARAIMTGNVAVGVKPYADMIAKFSVIGCPRHLLLTAARDIACVAVAPPGHLCGAEGMRQVLEFCIACIDEGLIEGTIAPGARLCIDGNAH